MGLSDNQKNNLNRILNIGMQQKIKFNGNERFLTVEEAHTVAWVAFCESTLNPNSMREGSNDTGLFHYQDKTWRGNFDKYGQNHGYYTGKDDVVRREAELQRWMSNKNDFDLQTKFFVNDVGQRLNDMINWNNGKGKASDWDYGGPIPYMNAKDAMSKYGLEYTDANYIYLAHVTDIRQEKLVLFIRLLDLDGTYSEIERIVETKYGQQIPDSYVNPSLVPQIQELANGIKLDISGMTNEQALTIIRTKYKLIPPAQRMKLLNSLSSTVPAKQFSFFNDLMSFFVSTAHAAETTRRVDPLILDLDGDGVETTNLKDGAYFDHDGNGFAEQTGWAKSDDGLLVMDRNADGIINDGKELFGDQTLLQNGQRATDGFQALAELDSNSDGVIDINDAAFSNLRIWQDVDGDGYSASDELFTLQEMGIQSINTGSESTYVDANGNKHRKTWGLAA